MKISDLAKRVIIAVLVMALTAVVISVIYYRSLQFLPFFYGVLLGTAASILRILLLERAIEKAFKMEKKKVGTYISLQHLLRLGIAAAALLIGALVPWINLWGAVTGVLIYQAALYVARLRSGKLSEVVSGAESDVPADPQPHEFSQEDNH